jgi:hypothetical protein
MSKDDDKPPFAGHRMYYVLLKVVVLAVAVALAYRYLAQG